jgi:hypothetical protein
MPQRMVFFDSESDTTVKITEDEIRRALQNQTSKQAGEPVRKHHDLYLIQADFYVPAKPIRNPKRDYYGSASRLTQFWTDVDEFTTWKQTTYIFAHNAKYDVLVTGCIPHLVELGYRVVGFSDANPFILTLHKLGEPNDEGKVPKKEIVIYSSTNYFAQSLAKLGKTFKLEKLEFDHDQKVDPKDPVFMDKALTYGRRDVDILKLAMLAFIRFVKDNKLGTFQATIAGQAFQAYRARFMPEDIHLHADNKALEVERRAYVGGRNEAFTIGEVSGTIYYVDINSMYPHVMRDKLYPKKLVSFWETATVQKVREMIMDNYLVCADVLIHTDKRLFHVKQERLIFPVGSYWTTLSTPEIIRAMDEGILLEIKNVCLYEAADLFSAYVDHFYGLRLTAKEEGDEVHDLMYKLFLNSLYGKTGQKNIKWLPVIEGLDPTIVGVENIYFADIGTSKYIKTFGGTSFEQYEEDDDIEAEHSFPAIAAHVTAHARMLLYHYLETAGFEHVHYCDTDSLFVDETGYKNLVDAGAIDPSKLGALKVEKVGDDLKIYGCKDYRFGGKTKTKGVPPSAYELGHDRAGKLSFAVTKWSGFTTRLKEGDMQHYYNEVMIKTLKREYQKGIIRDNGRVDPFVLDAAEDQKKQAQLEMHIANAEAAAALTIQETDPIKFWSLNIGYMQVPTKGNRYYNYYTKYVSKTAKMKYFRYDGAMTIDQFAEAARMKVDEILERITK